MGVQMYTMDAIDHLPRQRAAILAFLHGRPGAHVDDICRGLSMGAADVSCRLVLLEVKGGVRRLPGMRYERR